MEGGCSLGFRNLAILLKGIFVQGEDLWSRCVYMRRLLVLGKIYVKSGRGMFVQLEFVAPHVTFKFTDLMDF